MSEEQVINLHVPTCNDVVIGGQVITTVEDWNKVAGKQLKATPTFTQEDVEKADLALYSEMLQFYGNDTDLDEAFCKGITLAILSAVGRVEE